MAPLLTIDADHRSLFAALDHAVVGLAARVKAAAKVTGERIADGARGRVRRRTGTTAGAIVVEETYDGTGYAVFVKNPENPNLDVWLEFGTETMRPYPFLFASARLEEGAHLRRVEAAAQAAIDEQGLGD